MTPLTLEEVEAISSSEVITPAHLDVLRWLVWLPLLAREELVRTTRNPASTLWSHLNQLAKLGLVDYVMMNETGWPRRHHYYATDLGLYVLVRLDPRPISVYKLAMSYPVTRADLLERLARPRVHLACSELATRLIAEHPQGYRLTSYQQPYKESYIDTKGVKHTLIFDAAFLLQTERNASHAFYVRIDQPEHMLSLREVKTFINKYLSLRQATHLGQEIMPHFLLLSSRERFSFWADLVNRMTLPQGIALRDCGKPEGAREHMDLSWSIADIADLSKGAYTRIWTPFHALIEHRGTVNIQLDIQSFLDRVAAPRLVERFSQYFTFQRVLLRRDTRPLTRRKKGLPRYVNIALRSDAAPLIIRARRSRSTPSDGYSAAELVPQLDSAFYGGPQDRLYMTTLLTLALSDQQKEIIASLARHPYLSRSDLLTLLHHQDERLLTRQITPLVNLKLVKIYPWSEAPTWRERERYYLHETALRYLSCRHGLSPASYLFPHLSENRHAVSPLDRNVVWRHCGAWGLKSQMAHTNGLYRCTRSILETSYHSHAYQMLYWKSAREAVRWYRDPLTGETAYIRPDAELLYTTQELAEVRSLLIEYDRDTTSRNQLICKFRCYAEYQRETRITLPITLVITQNERAVDKIWGAWDEAKAFDVSVVVVLEEDVVEHGLLDILGQIR